MAELNIRFDIRLSPGVFRWALVALMLCAAAGDVGSESVTLNTYYPAPSGVYQYMVTTSNTFLARDGGAVNIGYASTNANSPGNSLFASDKIGIGTQTPGMNGAAETAGKWLAFQDLNNGANTTDGITWYNESPTAYGIYRTAGAWSGNNYQQLEMAWQTGVVIDGGTAYGKSGTVLQPNGGTVGIGANSIGAGLDVSSGGGVIMAEQTGCRELTYTNTNGASCTGGAEYATLTGGLMVAKTVLGNFAQVNADGTVSAELNTGTMLCCPMPPNMASFPGAW